VRSFVIRQAGYKSPLFICLLFLCLLLPTPVTAVTSQSHTPATLSSEEMRWIENHPVIRLAPDPTFQPFEFFDNEGSFQGIAADYMQLLEKKLGLHFEAVQLRDWSEVLDQIKTGQVDMISSVMKTDERSEYLNFSKPYLRFPYLFVARHGNLQKLSLQELKGKKVAVVNMYAIHELLKNNHPELNLVPVADFSEGLRGVSFGKYDVFVANLASLSYYIDREGISNLHVAGESGYFINLSIVARKDLPELISILDKGLDMISEQERSEIISKWIKLVDPSVHWWQLSREQIIVILTTLAGLIVLGILAWNYQLRKVVRNRTAKLKDSQEKLRRFYDLSPIGIALTGMDGHYIDFNQAFESICGYPKEELKKLDFWALTPRKYESDDTKQLDSLKKNGKYGPYEKEYIRKDGALIPVRLNGILITGEDGQEYIWSLVEDITESKLAEEKLRKLSRAVEQAGESVIITNKQGVIEYVNSSFTKITGYSAEEVLGQTPKVLKSGNQTTEYYAHLWKTISTGEIWHSAIIDRRKDGSEYPALMTISPIIDGDGEITHYVGVQQDMTTHEALEEKFRQAQKMEALGTLVGGIAHDFNNMLAGMSGNLYLAKNKAAGLPTVIEKLDNTLNLSFRAAEMIQQLLVFARKGAVQMKPFGLTSFIKQAYKLCEATLPESIAIKHEFCNEELMVKGDATQLQQVLMNLLNNSRDALINRPDPMVSIKLEAFEAGELFLKNHPDASSKLFAHLVVRDNGCGISDNEIQHIFEPFYTSKEVGKGTGLGLPMVYGAIEVHHGIIEVESKIESGTSVHIYLPLLETHKVKIAPTSLAKSTSGNGELILIVDDNADVRSTSKEVLEDLGYQVLEASDGLEAVKLFSANMDTIALIIMDVVMPRLGGVDAFEQIKELRSDAKVIFATGYDKDESLKDDMPSDDHIIISKPYEVFELSQLIRNQLDSS